MNHGTKPNETDCGTSCFLMRQIFSSVVGKKKTKIDLRSQLLHHMKSVNWRRKSNCCETLRKAN